MTHYVLWIDDHFDDVGEIGSPLETPNIFLHQPDRLLDVDKRELAHVRGFTVVPETRINGFIQQSLNHIRLALHLPVRPGRAYTFSALVIDIMITGVQEFPYPLLDPAGNVAFDSGGRVMDWTTAYSSGNGFDAGLVLVETFIVNEPHLAKLPCIFYTHRHIDAPLERRIEALCNRGIIARGYEKVAGIAPLLAELRDCLRVPE